jgi:hypothetical protein
MMRSKFGWAKAESKGHRAERTRSRGFMAEGILRTAEFLR